MKSARERGATHEHSHGGGKLDHRSNAASARHTRATRASVRYTDKESTLEGLREKAPLIARAVEKLRNQEQLSE